MRTKDLLPAGKRPADLPRLSCGRDGHVVVEAPERAPLRVGDPVHRYATGIDDISRDRVLLAPGVELRLHPRSGPGAGGAPSVGVSGRAERYRFGELLTDPTVFEPWMIEHTRRAIQDGAMSPGDYSFVGLARSHGAVYLGVAWHSNQRTPSNAYGRRDIAHLVLLRVSRAANGGLTFRAPLPFPVPPPGAALTGPPFGEIFGAAQMDALPSGLARGEGGDLLLVHHGWVWRFANGAWSTVQPDRMLLPTSLAPKPAPDYGPNPGIDLFLRGLYLLALRRALPDARRRQRVDVVVVDLRTKKHVRTLTWSEPALPAPAPYKPATRSSTGASGGRAASGRSR